MTTQENNKTLYVKTLPELLFLESATADLAFINALKECPPNPPTTTMPTDLMQLISSSSTLHSPKIHNLLSYLTPKIIELHRILKPTGNICIQADNHSQHYIKVILDRIYSKKLYHSSIILPTTVAYHTMHIYKKSPKAFYKPIFMPIKSSHVEKFYTHEDARGRYKLTPLNTTRSLPHASYHYDLGYGEASPPAGYRIPKKEMLALIEHNQIFIKKNHVPSKKIYMNSTRGVAMTNVWFDIHPTQQPTHLMARILESFTPPNTRNTIIIS